jgi:hypothetical protein
MIPENHALHDEARLLEAENVHNADNEPPKVMRLLAIAQRHATTLRRPDPTQTPRLRHQPGCRTRRHHPANDSTRCRPQDQAEAPSKRRSSMTPEQHAREAERLLADADRYDLGDPAQCAAAAVVTARAHVHATLATARPTRTGGRLIPERDRCSEGDALTRCVLPRGHRGQHQLEQRL